MKKIFLILSMLFLINVNALEKCTTEKIQDLKQKASYVDLDYEYKIVKMNDFELEEPVDVAIFNLKILNHDKNLRYNYKIEDGETQLEPGETVIEGLSGGVYVTVDIYAYTADACCDRLLKTKKLRLPVYNSQFDREECKEYPEFKYCQKLVETDIDITEEDFDEELEKYKNKLLNSNNQEEQQKIVVKEKYNYKIIFIVLGAILLLIITTIIVFIKTKKKRDDIL